MSDAHCLLPRPATDIDDVALGMIHLVVDTEFASLRDALALALADNHRLTILLAERDETIAALDALAAKLTAVVAALGGKPELTAAAKRNAEPCDCDAYPDEEHKERCRFWAAPLRVVREDDWIDRTHDSEVAK